MTPAKPKPDEPRQVVGIHRGPDRYWPHLGRTVSDGEEVPGLTAEQVEAAYYLELPKAASPKEP